MINRLDRILDWIKSCDTKASIVIAGLGIFLTISTSENTLKGFRKILDAVVNDFNFSMFLYCLFFLAAAGLIVWGLINLILVLVPRLGEYAQKLTGTSSKSLYFFGKISEMDYSTFKQDITGTGIASYDEIEDLLSQIYINAHICTVKYKHYRKGVISSFIGIFGVIVLYGIGFLLMEIGGF